MSQASSDTETGGGGDATSPTVRKVLRLLWEADRYPHLGNEDNRAAALLEQEALVKAPRAVSCPGDPPELAHWLAALQDRSLPNPARDAVMAALYDLFGLQSGTPCGDLTGGEK